MKKSKPSRPAIQPTEERRFPWTWVLPLAAVAVAFLIYGPSLNGPFVYDDLNLPFLDPVYHTSSFYSWVVGVRPVLMASYWVNFQWGGLDTTSYHFLNVLLHALNALLVGYIVSKFAELDWVAALCGALFLVHPLNTEAVSYVASRSENLTVFLYLAAFALFLYRKPGIMTSSAVLVLFGAACLSKEYAVTLPVLMLLTDLYFNPAGPKSNWRIYAPLLVAGAAGGVWVFGTLRQSDTAGFGLKDLGPAEYFLTQCRSIWVYIGQFIVPVGLNIDHDFPISRGVFDHGAVYYLIALLAVTAAALWFRKQYPVASYGWLVFLLLLAPTSSFVPIRDVLVERRVYLPELGLLLILADLVRRLRVPKYAYAVPLLLLAAMTYQRNQLWAEPLALWRDAASKSPNKWRVQFQVADAFYRQGDCAQSAAVYEKTHALAAPDYRLLINWAHSLDCAGQADPALERATQALELEKTAQAYSLIGMLHAKQNRTEESLAALNQAILIDGNFEAAYLYRGNVYMLLKDTAKAAADYQRALAINPGNQHAARGLASANRR